MLDGQGQQPSEPATPSGEATPGADAKGAAPAEAGKVAPALGAGDAAPADDSDARRKIGGNGGPEWDWRAEVSGGDTKALETLARMKAPTDLWKAYSELRGKFSAAQKPSLKLADDATPEQISEYRKAFEVPEVPKEAKDAAYAEAYGITPPDGYEMGEIEKQMLGGFAKAMNGAHAPKSIVQKAVGEYFKIQAATQAQSEKIAVEKKREWTGELRDKWGSKEYEARLAAANTWLRQEFAENEDEMHNLMGAQLPGGGRLGDHPWMIEKIAQMAMGAGFTDRIEANALESGGKSLADQQREIEALMFKDPAAYSAASKPGGRLEKLISLRMSRGELDEFGNEVRHRRTA